MFNFCNSLKILTSNITIQPVNIQIIRWRRKPRWLPTAKSKIFRVPVRPVIPEDEKQELMRLNNNYRNHVKSIKRYLVSRYVISGSKAVDQDNLHLFEEDYSNCCEINEKWNAQVKYEREGYFQNVLDKEINTAKQSLIERANIEKLELEEAEKLVREQKEASKYFITANNIDAAIEHALANPVDHNFAIDTEGNKLDKTCKTQ